MSGLFWWMAGCAYEVEVADTGRVVVERPVMELSTHEVYGPEGTDGTPPRWTFGFDILNTGAADLPFGLTSVYVRGPTMCLREGLTYCGVNDRPADPDDAPEVAEGSTPNPCRDYLTLADLPPDCRRTVHVTVEPDAPLGLVVVDAKAGPWSSTRVDGRVGLARDFVQEVAVRSTESWAAPVELVLEDPGLEVPFATGGQKELTWVLQNVGTVAATLEAVAFDCAEYVEVDAIAGVQIGPGERLAVAGEWAYGETPVDCEVMFLSDALPVVGKVHVLPEPWRGAPALSITLPAPATVVDPALAFTVQAELTDPQTGREWTARLGDLGGGWEVAAVRTGEGSLAFTVLDQPLATGPGTLRVVADDGERTVSATVPVVVSAAPTGDDADGWSVADGDCDDADAATYPGAAEADDGADNDCDLSVDEGTASADDDGDGYTEAAGDRDDADATVYAGAPERCDGADNDGDDLVDEETVCGDDDGDGWTEADGDCEDADAGVYPGGVDRCDADGDCDGVPLECGWADGVWAVGIGVDGDVCVSGETVSVQVYAWGASSVAVGADTTETYAAVEGLQAEWECPPVEEITVVTLYAVATTADGRQDWADTRLPYVLPVGTDIEVTLHEGGARTPWCGCDRMNAASAGALVLAASGLAMRRRRRA